VDVHNRIQGSYMGGEYDTMAVQGKDLVLTLDFELQEYGEKLMYNKIGSVVAIDPESGEILAMISSPSYNPNLLVGRNRGYYYDSLLNEPDKPLFNRAVSAAYPPGSIFKMVMALLGLQENVISKYTSLPCDHSIVGCHNHPPNTNLVHAIQYSCNPYFYVVGKRIIQQGVEKSIFKDSRIGLENWKKNVLTLGFEQKLEIGIPGVVLGSIPGPDYYDEIYGKYSWAYSTIYSLSIGQGEVLVVPVQMANLAAIIANRGYYYVPHLVRKIGDDFIDASYRQKHITPFDPVHFEPLVDGMFATINDEFGTGRFARIPNITVCGKTGTAQNPHGEDHSIFIAFAPKDKPKIAIAVYIENAGYGGVWAGPLASLMIEKYLTDTVTNTWNEKRILDANFVNIEDTTR
jgi:penicillin-binding protein 2